MSNDMDRLESVPEFHLLGIGSHCAALSSRNSLALERDDGCEGNTHVTVRNLGVGATLIRGIFSSSVPLNYPYNGYSSDSFQEVLCKYFLRQVDSHPPSNSVVSCTCVPRATLAHDCGFTLLDASTPHYPAAASTRVHGRAVFM